MASFLKKEKQYGLIIPTRKVAAKPVTRPSAFGDSSSDEEEDGKKHVNVALKRENEKRQKQTHEAAAQALAEDPSIFEYDSLYDKMTEEKKAKNPKLVKDTKPKYIHALKRAAERRKLEGELVYEHQAQREIEKDKEQFKDKESYVTSGYKKKLAERKALEEELAKEAAVEEANDVTKQKDLSRFHKHLFNQVVSAPGDTAKTKDERSSKETGHTEKESRTQREKERQDDGSSRRHSSDARESARERRRSSETEGRGGERERRRDSDRDRRREGTRRRSSDNHDHHRERRSSNRERRDSHSRREKTPEPTTTTDPATNAERLDTASSPQPPSKKIKIQAGIEVEVEEVDPVERRKLASAKKATEETTKSAKERFLARKKAKAEAEVRKHSTSDD